MHLQLPLVGRCFEVTVERRESSRRQGLAHKLLQLFNPDTIGDALVLPTDTFGELGHLLLGLLEHLQDGVLVNYLREGEDGIDTVRHSF